MCSECQRRETDNRKLWLAVRRLALGIIHAFDRRYGTGEYERDHRAA